MKIPVRTSSIIQPMTTLDWLSLLLFFTVFRFQVMLREGREAGYHTDEIFSEVESLVERANQLLDTCSSVLPWISTEAETLEFDKLPSQLVRFQIRLPAAFNVVAGSPGAISAVEGVKSTPSVSFITFQHEMDVHK